jgi:hypothetical protein
VFDPPESLLLGCRDELPVDQDRGRCVGMMSIDAENDHWQFPLPAGATAGDGFAS